MNPWVQAFRLRTLPLAFSGWVIGITLAGNEVSLNYPVAGLTLLTAFLLQILSNLANDYGDASSGVDAKRTGEVRMVQAGLISPVAMKRAIVLLALLSLISGLLLLYMAFTKDVGSALVFFLLGIGGIAAAIKYTVGHNPYGYVGFGDLFVFFFFGWVLVFGTYYVQTHAWNLQVLLPASALGMLSVGVLNVNNIRDIESDRQAGKQSIPVRLGRKAAIRYHAFLLIGSLILAASYVLLNFRSTVAFLFLLTAFPLIKNIRAVNSKPAHALDPWLKQMALSTLLFALLFAVGQVASFFF